MTARAIPEGLEQLLVDLAARTNAATGRAWTTRELAAWLLNAHGVQASHAAVANVLRRARDERRAATADAIREAITGRLGEQLAELDGMLREYLVEARTPQPGELEGDDAGDDGPKARGPKPPDRTKFAAIAVQALQMKLRYALGEKVDVSAEVDHTSGGAPLTFYVPRKVPDGEPGEGGDDAA